MAVIDYGPQIAAMNAAIAAGVTSVSYEGKSATYRSLNEMIQTVAYLTRLQAAANGTPRPVAGKATFSRGYGRRGLGPGLIRQRYNEDC